MRSKYGGMTLRLDRRNHLVHDEVLRDGCVSFAPRVLLDEGPHPDFSVEVRVAVNIPSRTCNGGKEHDFWEKSFGLASATPRCFAFGEVHDVPHIGKLKVVELAGLSCGLTKQGRGRSLDMRATEPKSLQLVDFKLRDKVPILSPLAADMSRIVGLLRPTRPGFRDFTLPVVVKAFHTLETVTLFTLKFEAAQPMAPQAILQLTKLSW
ncbi:hypothetical protein AaE_001544, partial [Aphanomyces astaci]